VRRFRQQHSLWVAIWQDCAHPDVRIAKPVKSPLHEWHRQSNSENHTGETTMRRCTEGWMPYWTDGGFSITTGQGQAAKDAASAGSRTAGADYRGRLTAFFPTKCIQVAPWNPAQRARTLPYYAPLAPRRTLQFLAGVLLHMLEIGFYRASGLTLSWDAHSSLLYFDPVRC